MSLLATTELIHKGQPLEEAFQAFNQISQHLTDSYQQLEQQVAVLSQELARANAEKIQHLSDKEALAGQLEGLIEALPGAVIVLNRKKSIVKANACARLWLQVDLIGQQWSALKAASLIESDHIDDQFTLQNGKVIALSTTRLMGQSGSVVLLSDITQQQKLHQQLEHKKKLAEMGEFSASLAHQIRTPLASALLYASQLSSDSLSKESQQKFSSKLLERLRRLNSQVTDMLNYSHKGQFMKTSVELRKFIDRLSDLYKDKLVEFHYPTNQGRQLYISEDAVIGALANLIDNALDARASHAKVVCEVAVYGSSNLKISIKDEGVGITAQEQQRIFEPFYSNKSNGTGLGLAVVKEVVNSHDGKIKCTSDIGVGTTMELTLPVVISASAQHLMRSY
ncbi:MAG: ATP-binding protein [Cycloclasticus sp.]|nr:ATP-binding protein [Cycloclasticus sp.]